MDATAERVVRWLRDASAVTVLTGAGISTDSGIPDYRGPNGVWTRNPEAARMSTLQDYVADPELRKRAWQLRKAHPAWSAEPNNAHESLVELEKSGRLLALLTQNIDELHQRAGSGRDTVVELHGTIWWAECLTCGVRSPMADELARVSDEEPDPACTLCGGMLKSATISFGQPLDPRVLQAAWRAAQGCDLFLAIGSSLTVQPAAGLCEVAVAAGARFLVIKCGPDPADGIADAVLREPIGDILPALVRAAVG